MGMQPLYRLPREHLNPFTRVSVATASLVGRDLQCVEGALRPQSGRQAPDRPQAYRPQTYGPQAMRQATGNYEAGPRSALPLSRRQALGRQAGPRPPAAPARQAGPSSMLLSLSTLTHLVGNRGTPKRIA